MAETKYLGVEGSPWKMYIDPAQVLPLFSFIQYLLYFRAHVSHFLNHSIYIGYSI